MFTIAGLISIVAILSVIAAREGELFSPYAIIFCMAFGVPALIVQYLCRDVYRVLFLWFFVAYGLNTPLFMLKQEYYTKTGWTAVGTFDFSAEQLLSSFLPIILIVATIFALSLTLGLKKRVDTTSNANPFLVDHPSRFYDAIICVGLVAIGIPINILMYENRVAMIGIPSGTELPFRLTGILYYGRLFLVPAILIVCLRRSSLSWAVIAACLTYAYCAGIAGLSRHVLVFTCGALCLVLFMRARFAKLALAGTVTVLGYGAISYARAPVYAGLFPEFFSLCAQPLSSVLNPSQFVDLLWAISARLYGAQEVVLANQTNSIASLGDAILNTLWNGVPTEDMVQQVYGFAPAPGQATGLGLIAGVAWVCQGDITGLIFSACLVFALIYTLELLTAVFLRDSNYAHLLERAVSFACVLLVMEGRLVQAFTLPFVAALFSKTLSLLLNRRKMREIKAIVNC